MEKIKSFVMPDTRAHDAVEYDTIKAFFDNTDDPMWSVDRNFNLLTFNRAFSENTGDFSSETTNIESNTFFNYLRFMRFYERTFSGESFMEIEYSNDPIELWFENSFFPIWKGHEVIAAACHSRNVTIAKREEQRLKLIESVVTTATDAVFITGANPLDGDGPLIVYVNDALIKMTGYTREEIIGKTPLMFQGQKSDQAELARAAMCLSNFEPCEIEIVNYKKDGCEFRMHIAIVPIADGYGVPTHCVSIGRDITERVENIAAIKEQNRKLTDIAWIQSHELRGPLARIQGLIDLLSNHLHSKDDTKLLGYLGISSNELDDVILKIVRQTEAVYGFDR